MYHPPPEPSDKLVCQRTTHYAGVNILTEFHSDRLQRVLVDGRFNEYRNAISGVTQGSILCLLPFILYTHVVGFGLENMLVSYADDATFLTHIPSTNMNADVTITK